MKPKTQDAASGRPGLPATNQPAGRQQASYNLLAAPDRWLSTCQPLSLSLILLVCLEPLSALIPSLNSTHPTWISSPSTPTISRSTSSSCLISPSAAPCRLMFLKSRKSPPKPSRDFLFNHLPWIHAVGPFMHTLRRNSSCRAMMPHGLERLLRCTQRPKLIQVPRFQNPIPLPFDRRPSTCQPLPTQALRLAPSQRQALPCPAQPDTIHLLLHHTTPHHTTLSRFSERPRPALSFIHHATAEPAYSFVMGLSNQFRPYTFRTRLSNEHFRILLPLLHHASHLQMCPCISWGCLMPRSHTPSALRQALAACRLISVTKAMTLSRDISRHSSHHVLGGERQNAICTPRLAICKFNGWPQYLPCTTSPPTLPPCLAPSPGPDHRPSLIGLPCQ